MKHSKRSNKPMQILIFGFSNKCMTFFDSTWMALLFFSFLSASCGPTNNNNYYSGSDTNPRNTPITNSAANGGGGGTGDGGGGQGVQCSEAKDSRIQNRLLVRDVYEAISDHKREMKTVVPITTDTMGLPLEAVEILVSSLQQYYGPSAAKIEFTKREFWLKFFGSISFVDADRELFPSRDANSPIALPKGCELVQIAFWDDTMGADSDGKLYVSRPLWKKLDPLNKAALLAHEFFFKQARKANRTNSDLVRLKIGTLLSVQGLAPIFPHWTPNEDPRVSDILPRSKKGFKVCEGTSKDDLQAKLQFYQYEGSDGNQHFIFPQIKSNLINAAPFENSSFTVPSDVITRSSVGLDLLIFNSVIKSLSPTTFNLFVNEDQWAKWRFNNAGMLSSKKMGEIPDFLSILRKNRVIIKPTSPLWSGLINPSSPIKLSLADPRKELGILISESKVKSKEDLIIATFAQIKSIIDFSCVGTILPKELFSEAIAQLNGEVDSAIARGVYPTEGFQKWNKKLGEIKDLALSEIGQTEANSELRGNSCIFDENKELTKRLPYFLFNLKLNNYTTEEVLEALAEKGFYSNEKEKSRDPLVAPPGQVEITQNNNTVTFELQCQDFTEIFLGRVQSELIEKSHDFSPNPLIEIKYGDLNPSVPDWQINTTSDQMHLLGNYLKIENSELTQTYRVAADSCKSQIKKNENQCKSYSQFAKDLAKETLLTIDTCTTFGFQDEDENIFCSIVKMKSSNNSFLLRYSHSQGWRTSSGAEIAYPHILFLQQLPGVELNNGKSSRKTSVK